MLNKQNPPSYKPVKAFNYDFLTPFYDGILNLIGFGDQQREKIVKLCKLQREEKLLDVGCGTGSLLIAAKRLHPDNEMVGIDIDKKVLEIAKRKLDSTSVQLINTGAENLPFPEKSFDVVVSTLIFHHLPTEIKRKALLEINRVLKPDGRFLLVDFGKIDGVLKLVYYAEVILRIPEAETAKDNVEGKIPSYLREAGFEFKEVAERYLGIRYLLSKKQN